MSIRTRRGRRLVRELERAIAEGNPRHVVDLVEAYGLPRAERLGVARALQPITAGEPIRVSDVWVGRSRDL